MGFLFWIRIGILLSVFSASYVKAEEEKHFPITKDTPRVDRWLKISEDTPSGETKNPFILRYFSATEEDEKFGPYGLTLSSKEVPELGILYKAWNVKKNKDGGYDFTQAVYAHRLDGDDLWFVAKPGLIIRAGKGYTDVAHVVVYRRLSKLGETKKIVTEYRVRYSSKTVFEVVFKITDPHNDWKETYIFRLRLNRTPMGEKTIQKEERLP